MSSSHSAGSILAAFTALALIPHPLHAQAFGKDILGTWRLTKVLDSADIASLTTQQAAALVGKQLVIRRDSVMFNGEPCRAPELTRHRENAARYVREGYHARVGYLGLPDTITVIDLDCTEAFLKSEGKIVVFWRGYFFDAVKQPSAAH
jgi:hypothetical protein